MSTGNSSLNFNGITSLIQEAGPAVVNAIHKASTATGVDFAYLMKKASVESGFKTDATAKTSSASGLYQFLDKTWMSMVKKYGDKYGMGKLADKIDDNGNCDNATRKKILSLRNDPEKAACLAAEYDSDNRDYLQLHTTGAVGPTELYMAHFMGAGGATGFLNAMKDNPMQSAATLFPKAAAANHNVFYDASGKSRSLAQVYDSFAQKFGGGTQTASQGSAFDSVTALDNTQASAAATIADGDDTISNAVVSMLNMKSTGTASTNTGAASQGSLYRQADSRTTSTHSVGTIHWNSNRVVVSPTSAMSIDAVHLAMMSKTNLNHGGRYTNQYD